MVSYVPPGAIPEINRARGRREHGLNRAAGDWPFDAMVVRSTAMTRSPWRTNRPLDLGAQALQIARRQTTEFLCTIVADTHVLDRIFEAEIVPDDPERIMRSLGIVLAGLHHTQAGLAFQDESLVEPLRGLANAAGETVLNIGPPDLSYRPYTAIIIQTRRPWGGDLGSGAAPRNLMA